MLLTPNLSWAKTIVGIIFISTSSLFAGSLNPCDFLFAGIEDQCIIDKNAFMELPIFIKGGPKHANSDILVQVLNPNDQVIWSVKSTPNQSGHLLHNLKFVPRLEGTFKVLLSCNDRLVGFQDFNVFLQPQYVVQIKQNTCHNSGDGAIFITPQRGQVLSYKWSDGITSEKRENLAPGKYQVTVTNHRSCERVEQLVIQKKEPIAIVLKTALYECNGAIDSLAVLEIEGGRPPYLIDWSNDGLGDYDDNDRITTLSEGIFQLHVRDADYCEVQLDVNILYEDRRELKSKSIVLKPLFRDNGLFVYNLSLTVDPLYGDIDNDGQDGSIFHVSYHESQNSAELGEAPMSTMYNSDHSKTIYARVESEMGCFVISQIALAENDYCLRQSEACDNDPLLLLEPTECDAASTPLPGNGTYEVFRKIGGDLFPAPELLVCMNMNAQCFIDPTDASGNYEVFYTYMKNGVSNTRRAFFDIQEVNPQVNLGLNLICPGDPVFDIRANPVGGALTGPGIVGNLISGSNQFFYVDPDSLEAGEWNVFHYTYSQLNFSGLICSKTTSDSIFVSDIITVEIDGSDFQSCANSEITLQAVNFRGPITKIEWYDPDGMIIGTSTQVDFPLTKGGIYSINAFGADGCVVSDSISVEILELPILICDIEASISCPNGADATASVNLPGVSDTSGYVIEWSNGGTGFSQANLSAGRYSVKVTAPNGCFDSCVIDIIAPLLMDIECNHVLNPVTCFGGSDGIDSMYVTGGTPPYLYSRDNITFQSSPIFTDVNGGHHRFYVRDANDCLDSCDFNMPEPTEFFCTSESIGFISCQGDNDGRITINPVGGVPPYTYQWSNGATTRTISNLSAGTYSVITLDSLGCNCSNSFTLFDPPLLSVFINDDTVSCFNASDGILSAQVSGGTPPYQIEWSNLSIGTTIQNLSSGSYSVIVTDQNGCMADAQAVVINPSVLELMCSEDLLLCSGDQNGELTVTANGGTMPYSYAWSNGQTTPTANQFSAGDQKVTVTDAKGCVDSCFGLISEPLPISIDIERDSVCLDLRNNITADVSGGVGGFTYSWSIEDDGGTGATLANLENANGPVLSFNSFCLLPGTVILNLSVEDFNGCTMSSLVPFKIYCCFDLAIRKTIEKSSDYTPSEIAEFDIEVFNQGEIDAYDIVIRDSAQVGMTIRASENTAQLTGNQYDWIKTIGDVLETKIDFIPSGSSHRLKIITNIDHDFDGFELTNYTEIVFYTNGLKDNPIDEDDFQPEFFPRLERNNDIDDDINGRFDNPNDEDKMDFETIFLCTEQPFACNDHVQISLDENGIAIITPDMVGEGLVSPAFIEITIKDENKNIISDTLNCSHIGQILEYSIYNVCTDVSCWGNLTVEDKLPPVPLCARVDTIYCHETDLMLRPDTVFDNCGPWIEFIISDKTVKYPCDSLFSGKRTIQRIYKDSFGNESNPCLYTIYYKRYSALDIVWPNDTIIQCSKFINANPSQVGLPTVNGRSIYPMDLGCSLALKFKDDTLKSCGSTMKILRQWTAIDWCPNSGIENPFFHVQLIKTIDIEAPVVYCPSTQFFVDTIKANNNCQGGFILPEPHRLLPGQTIIDSQAIYVISECSEFTYSVLHTPADDPENCRPSNKPATSNNIRLLSNGRFEAFDLPYGCNWFYYTVTDKCGNQSQCTFDVFIKDSMPPVAICDQHTIVSLGLSGSAELPATSLDAGSTDNCSIDTMLVRRMDGTPCAGPLGLNDKVLFCCSDVGEIIRVELVVIDECGNSNSCMVEVEVQSKIIPQLIYCPGNVTLDCNQDYRDTSLTGGSARFEGVCPIQITYEDSPNLNDCGVGQVTRLWKASDAIGRSINSCTQIIKLKDDHPLLLSDIQWPDSIVELTGSCDIVADISITGRPEVLSIGCHDILMTHSDKTLSHGDSSCVKILRTWTVVDWCIFNISTGEGEWTFEQTVIINNKTPPQVFCRDTIISVLDNQCGIDVEIHGNANDDCTLPEDFVWLIQLDLFNDGSVDHNSFSSYLTHFLPLGNHRVNYIVNDGCGNEDKCEEIWTVRDAKSPSPICKTGIVTVIMNQSGTATVWANDLNEKSFDNCTVPMDLKFSFSSNPLDDSITFDCSDIDNGVSDTIQVELWVTDTSGNQDFCSTTIILQDNQNNICADRISNNIVKGRILCTNGNEIQDAQVTCLHKASGKEEKRMTNSEGLFEFKNVFRNQELIFSSFKSDDWLQGISTRDLIFIQQHLLGKKTFYKGSQYLAADVTNDQTVSARDIVALRKLILGRIDRFPNDQDSWRFVDKEFTFDMINPYEFQEKIEWIPGRHNKVNFIGIKIGDVDDSYENLDGNQTRSGDFISFYWKKTEGGWALMSKEDIELKGFQLHFECENIEGIQSPYLPLDDGNYHLSTDEIKISWNGIQSQMIESGKQLFELITTGKNPPELKLSDYHEIYNSQLDVFRPELISESELNHFSLFQNIPNPFDHSTIIPFQLNVSSQVELTVFNSNGELVYEISGYYSSGSYEIRLTSEVLRQKGVMYYRMKANDQIEIRKMIRL